MTRKWHDQGNNLGGCRSCYCAKCESNIAIMGMGMGMGMGMIFSPCAGYLHAGEEHCGLEVDGKLDVGQVGQAQQRVDNVAVVLGQIKSNQI